VTVDGKILDATPEKNSDLYWALGGGGDGTCGGGTHGVVISITVKAHPGQRPASAHSTFGSRWVTKDQFYHAVRAFHKIFSNYHPQVEPRFTLSKPLGFL
jgi:FAD/FMN-containing dehydrogenase